MISETKIRIMTMTTLRDEIKDYTDGDGLVAPGLSKGAYRSSDNGVMFTSEYYIMLHKLMDIQTQDYKDYYQLIVACEEDIGLLCRAPGDKGQEGPDDYYAVLSASQVLGIPEFASVILHYGYITKGWFNNENPGTIYRTDGKTINWEAFLWRQLQMWFAALCAARENRWYHLPLSIYSALVILYTGLRNLPKTDADSRRLCWHLIQATVPRSFLCRLASKVWYRKLYLDYPNGMRGVAQQYYQDGHPFREYWVD